MTIFILSLQILALFVQLAAPTSPSCECPSCNQRNQAERCRCCVYRQLGKRSGHHAIADYPQVDDHPDNGGGPESSPPVLFLQDGDGVATKLTDYLNANPELEPTENFATRDRPWLSLDLTNFDSDQGRLLKLNYVIQLLRNNNDISS